LIANRQNRQPTTTAFLSQQKNKKKLALLLVKPGDLVVLIVH
jgi:hypothetical protein